MQIALLSDIHGNLVSLDAVLADVQKQQVDDIVFLGDLATLGPQPREVVARMRSLNCHYISGNHETYLFDPAAMHAYSDDPWLRDAIAWCRQQLSTEDLAFIHSFKPFLEIDLDPTHHQTAKLFCFHGSPRSNADKILATTPRKKLKAMLREHEAAVFAGGHTHIQMMRQHQGILIINPGSVGQPFAQSSFKHTPRVMPWAEYAIVSWEQGVLNVNLRRVPIDLHAVRQATINSALPGKHAWMNNWQNNGAA
ncbi:MAG: metallophosphoesterase family protein [Anaerolinea sp.]|nr:metallophosphoesterase family protein [Anaerolinea sp.]